MGAIQDILRARAELGLAELLLSVYDYAYCRSAGLPCEAPTHAGMRDLLVTLEARHRDEVLAPRGWADPPLLSDELPGWLLAHVSRQVLETAPLKGGER